MPRVIRRTRKKRVPKRRIVLLGGSFDPCHLGHIGVSMNVAKRLGAHAIWWIVTPENPLKPPPSQPLAQRVAAAKRFTKNHNITVTTSACTGPEYTHQTISTLIAKHRYCRFVWLVGADNWLCFHEWMNFRAIAKKIAIMVAPRGQYGIRAGLSKSSRLFSKARRRASACVWHHRLPFWASVQFRKIALSSSDIRNNMNDHTTRKR